MNIEKNEYERLARYLSGESSEQEIKKIESRINKDPMFVIFIEKLKKIWDLKSVAPNPYDVEAAWNQLSKEIDYAESHLTDASEKKPSKARKLAKQKEPRIKWLIQVAAVFMVIGLTTLFMVLYMGESTEEEQSTMREVVTENGQRSNIHLQDGSRITLNSGSRITYAREFGEDSRIAHVEGEAYFDIAHDSRPFYVYADGAVIQILGTEFNVRSYNEEDIKIAVAQGLVVVKYAGAPDEYAVNLEKGDMAKLPRNGQNEPIVNRSIDLKQHIGWLDYRFSFSDTPLEVMAKQLERSYGVEIEFLDSELSKLRISASFEGESIHEVLQVIQLVLGLEYEMSGRKILFSKLDPELGE